MNNPFKTMSKRRRYTIYAIFALGVAWMATLDYLQTGKLVPTQPVEAVATTPAPPPGG